MGLYERWTVTSIEGGVGEDKIPVHAFGAAMAEAARGSLTVAQIVSAFSLDATAQTELDAIVQKYTDLPNATAKAAWMSKFHDVLMLCESGHYSKAKAKTELGF